MTDTSDRRNEPAELSDDQQQALFEQNKAKYRRLMVAKKAADKAVRDFGKVAKSDHGACGMDMIKLAIKIEENGDEAIAEAKERLEQEARVMRWSGLPMGFQEAMFGDENSVTLEEKAFISGKVAGMRGESMTAPVEFGSGDAYQEWCKGWHKGQEAIFAIERGPVDVPEDEPEKKEELSEEEADKIFDEGVDAFRFEQMLDNNPYDAGTLKADAWIEGFEAQKKEDLEKASTDEKTTAESGETIN